MNKASVMFNQSDVFVLTDALISELKLHAQSTALNRARINVHKNTEDPVHEMIIALTKDCIFRPHRHLDKSESFHMIEGEMVVMIFDDNGNIKNAILLGGLNSLSQENAKYYRLDSPQWHAILPLSEYVVFHETTRGPFIPGQHEFAPFIDGDPEKIKTFYINALKLFQS